MKDKDKELLIQVSKNKHSGIFSVKWIKFPSGAPRSEPHFPSSPLQENFCGTSIIVPDLEGVLHLKEDGKKSWKQRLFQLRASGIYYVPKGKTKVRSQKKGTNWTHPR